MWLPPAHSQLDTWPATQACAPTGNQTGDPSVHRLALNLLSRTSRDKKKGNSDTAYYVDELEDVMLNKTSQSLTEIYSMILLTGCTQIIKIIELWVPGLGKGQMRGYY